MPRLVEARARGRDFDLALIPARGRSEGLPGKNIRPLAGRPLIAHTIASAVESRLFAEVHVSTEDEAIAEIATAHGASVIARPRELALAETPTAPVVEHAVSWCERERGSRPRAIFLLEPTSPLRRAEDIREAAALLGQPDCDAAMGVYEAKDVPEWTLRARPDGTLAPAYPRLFLSRRQDLPPSYIPGLVYAIETDAFLETRGFLTDRTRFFVVPEIRAVDIDTETDFAFAEFLIERGALHAAPRAVRAGAS